MIEVHYQGYFEEYILWVVEAPWSWLVGSSPEISKEDCSSPGHTLTII